MAQNIAYQGTVTDESQAIERAENDAASPKQLIQAATRKPGKSDRRAIVEAVFYQVRIGRQWRYLPREYPNGKTVYSLFLALATQWGVGTGAPSAPTPGLKKWPSGPNSL